MVYEISRAVKEVIGVGFGPANLALAIALHESTMFHRDRLGDNVLFLERQPAFGWHRGMLIEDATMQVSFLKDLATMRNPVSEFTFVSYLHAVGRLTEFINSKTVTPYRAEFHGYLQWAANRLDHVVEYDAEVIDIQPAYHDGIAWHLDVTMRRSSGQTEVHRTRNVVIGTGLTAHLPGNVTESPRVWHSEDLLGRIANWTGAPPRSFAVVGAGQSAAEVTAYLHGRFPDAQVHAIFSRFGYSVADDSPLTNRIFDPPAVDDFFTAPEEVKEMMLEYHGNTNYSVVDLPLTEHLHAITYRERISGDRRLHLHNQSRIRSVEDTGDEVRLRVEFLPTSQARNMSVDALICATGYRPSDPLPLLAGLESECKKDGRGRIVLGRDYQVITSDSIKCGIYLHGAAAEHTHGLSAGLLSNVAVRAAELTQSIADHML